MANNPRRIGRFELLRRIGAGGMGEVWLSRLPSIPGIDKVCVVKTILPHLASEPQFVGRFLDEAKVVVHLNHGNIAQVFEMGCVDEQYFMAMEYVEGKTLGRIAQRLRDQDRTFPLSIALFVGMKICDGLAYAHGKSDPAGNPLSIVHRDVSPANVMVSYQGEVKIIDFGASLHAAKEEQTAPRVVIGNLAYMSPEQARKQPVDHRADIFATGIVLWEVIAWQVLPTGGDYVERWRRAAYPKYEKPSSHVPSMPADVDRVIMRAISTNPADRPQTADEFRDELSRCLAKVDPSTSQSSLSAFVLDLFKGEAERERRAVAGALAGLETEDAGKPLLDEFPLDADVAPRRLPVTDLTTGQAPVHHDSAEVIQISSGEILPPSPAVPWTRSEPTVVPLGRDSTDPDRTVQATRAELMALAESLGTDFPVAHDDAPTRPLPSLASPVPSIPDEVSEVTSPERLSGGTQRRPVPEAARPPAHTPVMLKVDSDADRGMSARSAAAPGPPTASQDPLKQTIAYDAPTRSGDASDRRVKVAAPLPAPRDSGARAPTAASSGDTTVATTPPSTEAPRVQQPRPPAAIRPRTSTDTGGRTRYYPSPRNLTLLLGAAVFLAALLLGFLIVAAAARDSDAIPAQETPKAQDR